MDQKELLYFFTQFPMMGVMGFVLYKLLNMFREDVREREKVIIDIYEKAFKSQQDDHEKALKVVTDFIEVLRQNGCYAIRDSAVNGQRKPDHKS